MGPRHDGLALWGIAAKTQHCNPSLVLPLLGEHHIPC